jgi:hypothetical protein
MKLKENQERSVIYIMQLQLIVAIIVAILAVVFALQNAVPITVSFLTWRFESSLALVLLINSDEFVSLSTFDDKEKEDDFQSEEKDSGNGKRPTKRNWNQNKRGN